MATFELTAESVLERSLPEVFAFFAEARNLEAITPPWLRFEVLTPEPIRMAAGTLVDYRLRLRGVPLSWRSEISAWEPPFRFVDEQTRGPYRLWVHEHTFESSGSFTVARDRVRYSAPGRSGQPVARGARSAEDLHVPPGSPDPTVRLAVHARHHPTPRPGRLRRLLAAARWRLIPLFVQM